MELGCIKAIKKELLSYQTPKVSFSLCGISTKRLPGDIYKQ